jgi:hypothetical protein
MNAKEKEILDKSSEEFRKKAEHQLICSCGFDEFRVYQNPEKHETFIECLVCLKTYKIDGDN